MAIRSQLLDMSPLGMRFTVLKAGADTNGQSLDLHWHLLPGCNMKDPLIHIHPNAIETYEILQGEMEFYIGDQWQTARKGDQLTVKAGVRHAFRNPSQDVVSVFNTHQPAFRMENYFEDVCKVLDRVMNGRKREFNHEPEDNAIHGSAYTGNYRNEIIASSPPDAAIKALGYLGKVPSAALLGTMQEKELLCADAHKFSL